MRQPAIMRLGEGECCDCSCWQAGRSLRVGNGIGAVLQALWDEALAGNEGRCPNLDLLHAYMHACNLSGQVTNLLLLSAAQPTSTKE